MSFTEIKNTLIEFYKKNLDYIVKLLVIFISAVYPFILLSLGGEMKSLSQYWNTFLQPVFIVANVITGYFFFSTENWRVPSFLLVLLTAFSVKLYPITHDIIATGFFLSCLYPLFKSKRFRFFSYLYLISPIVGLFYGLLWLEIWGILILCAYHFTSIANILWILYKKRGIESNLD
jgi:hypothetical protein